MEYFEHKTKERMAREFAAERLRELADQLSRNNSLTYLREGVRFTIDVPDEVELKLEVEIEDDGSEIEVEITW
jgi:amphi-Trp domain-containing protein